jgi:hypothetical protein
MFIISIAQPKFIIKFQFFACSKTITNRQLQLKFTAFQNNSKTVFLMLYLFDLLTIFKIKVLTFSYIEKINYCQLQLKFTVFQNNSMYINQYF